MRKKFNFAIAENILHEMLDDLVERRKGWGRGSTFVLTEDDIEIIFQVGPIFLRIIMCWVYHKSVKAQLLLQRKQEILYKYRRLLPLHGLTSVYPAS